MCKCKIGKLCTIVEGFHSCLYCQFRNLWRAYALASQKIYYSLDKTPVNSKDRLQVLHLIDLPLPFFQAQSFWVDHQTQRSHLDLNSIKILHSATVEVPANPSATSFTRNLRSYGGVVPL
jgi:hypothetical protein